MKVSVAIITYKHEQYIAQALDGVLAQRANFPIEVVVRDDHSPDRTGGIVREYAAKHPDKIRVLPSEVNLGPIPNLARVLAACTGEYVAILEGDDYWTDPDKLQRQVEFLDSSPGHTFSFHRVAEVNQHGRQRRVIPQTSRVDFTFADLFPYNFIPTCSIMFRRRLVPEIPAWMLSQLPGDWPLHMLSAQHGPFRMLPQCMGVYRIHSGGIWSQGQSVDRFRRTIRMLDAARQHFGSEPGEHLDCGIALHRFGLAGLLAAEGNHTAAKHELTAVLADPGLRPHLPRWRVAVLRLMTRTPPAFLRTLLAARRLWFDRV